MEQDTSLGQPIPFPTSETAPPTEARTAPPELGTRADASVPPRGSEFVNRAARSAHQTIDRLASKATAALASTSASSSVASEWIAAARAAIRERPVAAIGVALLIGAAAAQLRSSRRR